MNKKLVIVRGASCSGKTTICKEIRNFDKKIAWVSIDNFKKIFSNFEDRALDDVNESAIAVINHLFDKNYSVIVDGIFKKPWHLENILKIAKEKDIPYVIYQLECSLETLKKRDKTREGVSKGWFEPLGDELIEGLYKKVQENPIEGVIKLNSEEKSMEECIDTIRKSFD